MKTVVYGAGVYGEIFCNEIESNGLKIDYIIDEYTKKEKIGDIHIKRLNEVSLQDCNIYISITSPKTEVEVINTLTELKPNSIHSFIETIKIYPKLITKCLELTKAWYRSSSKEMINYELIDKFKGLLKDKKSLELLDRVVSFRESLNPDFYPIPDLEEQYFPSDIPLFEACDKIRFVDGGAFIGDTLSSSVKEFKKIDKELDYICSFEPDVDNIKKLSNEVKNQKDLNLQTNFMIYPCALWSENKVLSFNVNSDSNSSLINEVGSKKIEIMGVSLDEVLLGANPNYLKMDIEGAEYNAILGMKELIKDKTPSLAICIYHKPADLWELPLLINSINNNYDMYLRIYGSMGLELVLYCVERESCID